MHQRECVPVNEHQNITTCQHWIHSNFENEGPFNPSTPVNNSSVTRNLYTRRADPFLPENRIPLPKLHSNKTENIDYEVISNGEGHDSAFFYALQSPSNERRRNERERQRVRSVNEGFERLRKFLPITHLCQDETAYVVASTNKMKRYQKRRFSKVDVLRAAIVYIKHLQGLLKEEQLCRY